MSIDDRPLIGQQVQYPTPWRVAEIRDGKTFVECAEGHWVAEVPSDDLAALIVQVVNRHAAAREAATPVPGRCGHECSEQHTYQDPCAQAIDDTALGNAVAGWRRRALSAEQRNIDLNDAAEHLAELANTRDIEFSALAEAINRVTRHVRPEVNER